jgi:adenosine kinase
MRTLITGSLAYDTIMVFPDHFSRHILPEQAKVLSVSFQIGEMRREWGGCAGNIAYNLKHIGGDPVVMATIGDDGLEYKERLAAFGIAVDGVRHVPGAYTGQAFIITDLDDNQITAFHPGAMNYSHQSRVGDVADIGLGIIAPDGKEGMHSHAEQMAQAGIPYIFDPGQGMTLFDGPELVAMIEKARYVAVNDYEGRMLAERTGIPLAQDRRARRGADRDAWCGRLGDPCRRRDLCHSGGEGDRGPRSHRLRRRVSRGSAVRDRRRLGLGAHRRLGLGARRDQDRLARRAEARLDAG